MSATALILVLISRIWLFFEPIQLFVELTFLDTAKGVGLGLSLSCISALVYALWPAYRRSADFYLSFVLAPLIPADGNLGWAATWHERRATVSRSYATGHWAQCDWIGCVESLLWGVAYVWPAAMALRSLGHCHWADTGREHFNDGQFAGADCGTRDN